MSSAYAKRMLPLAFRTCSDQNNRLVARLFSYHPQGGGEGGFTATPTGMDDSLSPFVSRLAPFRREGSASSLGNNVHYLSAVMNKVHDLGKL